MFYKKIITNKDNIFIGPCVVERDVFEDSRGIFFESWNKKEFQNKLNINSDFVQDNISKSSKGVLRGLHYQLEPKSQGKLILCNNGSIYDVIVDLRVNSNTFGEWGFAYLNTKNNSQIWVPSGFAHGFLALENDTIIQYKTTNYWDKNLERSILWNDPKLNINWPLDNVNLNNPQISLKDSKAITFSQAKDLGELFS